MSENLMREQLIARGQAKLRAAQARLRSQGVLAPHRVKHDFPATARALNFHHEVEHCDPHTMITIAPLQNHQLGYHSDIDAPINTASPQVLPYKHAIEDNPYLTEISHLLAPELESGRNQSRSQSRSQSRLAMEANPYLADVSTILPVLQEGPEASQLSSSSSLSQPSLSITPTVQFTSIDASQATPHEAQAHVVGTTTLEDSPESTVLRPKPISPKAPTASVTANVAMNSVADLETPVHPIDQPLSSTSNPPSNKAEKSSRTGRSSRANSSTSRGPTPSALGIVPSSLGLPVGDQSDLVDVPLTSEATVPTPQPQMTSDITIASVVHSHVHPATVTDTHLLLAHALRSGSQSEHVSTEAWRHTLAELAALREQLAQAELRVTDATTREETISAQLASVSKDNALLATMVSDMEREAEERERQLAKFYAGRFKEQAGEASAWRDSFEQAQKSVISLQNQLETVQVAFQASSVAKRVHTTSTLSLERESEGDMIVTSELAIDRESNDWMSLFLQQTRQLYDEVATVDSSNSNYQLDKIQLDPNWILSLRERILDIVDYFDKNFKEADSQLPDTLVIEDDKGAKTNLAVDDNESLSNTTDKAVFTNAIVELRRRLETLRSYFTDIITNLPTQDIESQTESSFGGTEITNIPPQASTSSVLLQNEQAFALRTQAIVAAVAAQTAQALLTMRDLQMTREKKQLSSKIHALQTSLEEASERVQAMESDRRALARKIDQLVEERMLRERTTQAVVDRLAQELELRASEAKFASEERRELDHVLALIRQRGEAADKNDDQMPVDEYSSALTRLQSRNLDLLQELRDRNLLIDRLRKELEERTAAAEDPVGTSMIPHGPTTMAKSHSDEKVSAAKISSHMDTEIDDSDPLDEFMKLEADGARLVRASSDIPPAVSSDYFRGIPQHHMSSSVLREDDVVSTITMITDDGSIRAPSAMPEGSLPLLGLETGISNLSFASFTQQSLTAHETSELKTKLNNLTTTTNAAVRGLSALLPPAPLEADSDDVLALPLESSLPNASTFVPEVKAMPSATALERSSDLSSIALAALPPDQLRKRQEQLRAQEESEARNRLQRQHEQHAVIKTDDQDDDPHDSAPQSSELTVMSRPARSVSFSGADYAGARGTSSTTLENLHLSPDSNKYPTSFSAVSGLSAASSNDSANIQVYPIVQDRTHGMALSAPSSECDPHSSPATSSMPSENADAVLPGSPGAIADDGLPKSHSSNSSDDSKDACTTATIAAAAPKEVSNQSKPFSNDKPKRELPTSFILTLIEMLGMWQANPKSSATVPSRNGTANTQEYVQSLIANNPHVWEEVIEV